MSVVEASKKRAPQIRQYDLVERVSEHDPSADEQALNRAYVFSMARHGSQVRDSGDPYFSHPLEVAGILADLKLDTASIITGLLHDTVEDGVAEQGEIYSLFGDEIGRLVDGVTKLSKIELQSHTERQAENFRKFVLAMSEDIRVLLVKLADRLHNMRTLEFINKPDRRRRIALETMEIYAPLAERIGMQRFKDELEDLAFAETNPEARDSLVTRLDFLRRTEGQVIPEIAEELEATLEKNGITAEVMGREKRPYSIWRKMERKHVPFEQIADVMAFRIIVEDEADCYRALGAVHSAYPMIPGRFKDYVSTPKQNGYRSLHTAVIGPQKRRIEIQIRDQDMHEVGELGVAAHWLYKRGLDDAAERPHDGRQYGWLRHLLDILEHASGPEEFLEHTKLEMFADQVFCFSPKGDLITLPIEATPVDFAYAVHSDIGDTCVGAKINGRLGPLRTVLSNGDQVEILRSSVPAPDPNWENFVVTGKARARVRRFVRQREMAEYASLGQAILEKTFANHDQPFGDQQVKPVLGKFSVAKVSELCAAVGRGEIDSEAVLVALRPDLAVEPNKVVPIARGQRQRGPDGAVPIKGLTPGMAVHMAECCYPLPGDRIVGLVTEGRGVTIHTIDCDVLESFSNAPERWLDVSWDTESDALDVHTGRIVTVINNVPGSLNALTEAIARSGGNISNLKIDYRSPDFFELVVDVEVEDVRHLTSIVAALRANPAIYRVERARG
jgi:GTP pyrophosphokinase